VSDDMSVDRRLFSIRISMNSNDQVSYSSMLAVEFYASRRRIRICMCLMQALWKIV
jgi:hypothetical protein